RPGPPDRPRARDPAARRTRLHLPRDRRAPRDLPAHRGEPRVGGPAQAAARQPPPAVALGGGAQPVAPVGLASHVLGRALAATWAAAAVTAAAAPGPALGPRRDDPQAETLVSVVVPMRDEERNAAACVAA